MLLVAAALKSGGAVSRSSREKPQAGGPRYWFLRLC